GAGIDLDEQRGRAALPGDFLGQRLGEARPIDGMDGVEQRNRLLRLVRLQRAHEGKLDAAMALLERRPVRLRLLHAILAEHVVAGGDHGLDRICAERLGNRDQRHRGRIAPRLGAGARDLIANLGPGAVRAHALRRSLSNSSTIAFLIARCREPVHWASWKMTPSVWRRPDRRRPTPWRLLTR